MDYGFLDRILGKGFVANLKEELAKVKVAWEARSLATDQQHQEVMSLVEGTLKSLEAIAGRLESIEKTITEKKNGTQ